MWAMGSPVSYPTDSFPGDSRSPEEVPPHSCSRRSEILIVKVMPRNQLLRTEESLLGLEEGMGSALPFHWSWKLGEWLSSILYVQGVPECNLIYIFPVYVSCFMRQFSHPFISPTKLGVLIPILLPKDESRI